MSSSSARLTYTVTNRLRVATLAAITQHMVKILHKMIRILPPDVSLYPHIKTIYPNPDHCILLEVFEIDG